MTDKKLEVIENKLDNLTNLVKLLIDAQINNIVLTDLVGENSASSGSNLGSKSSYGVKKLNKVDMKKITVFTDDLSEFICETYIKDISDIDSINDKPKSTVINNVKNRFSWFYKNIHNIRLEVLELPNIKDFIINDIYSKGVNLTVADILLRESITIYAKFKEEPFFKEYTKKLKNRYKFD